MVIKKIVEFISHKRMDLFQGMFFKLFEKYDGDWDKFLDEWFEYHSYRILKEYFREEIFKEDLDRFYSERRDVIRAYIKAYWSFCLNPNKRSNNLKNAMEYFNIEELEESELKKRYREMVKKYHPDVNPDKAYANQKMIEINHYFQILKAYISKTKGEYYGGN